MQPSKPREVAGRQQMEEGDRGYVTESGPKSGKRRRRRYRCDARNKGCEAGNRGKTRKGRRNEPLGGTPEFLQADSCVETGAKQIMVDRMNREEER